MQTESAVANSVRCGLSLSTHPLVAASHDGDTSVLYTQSGERGWVFSPSKKDIKRFYKYVYKMSDCWIWTGYCDKNGYGIFQCKGHPIYAHRFSLSLIQTLPKSKNKLVLHKCANPSCVNPKHIYYGTHIDNMRDAFIHQILVFIKENNVQ